MSDRSGLRITAKLAAVAVVTALLFVLVVNAMRNPVGSATVEYNADFTDASGLHVNGDVRQKGLRIGKVTGVDLVEVDTRALARVRFSMLDGYELTDTSRLAIKYQNLTGIRYVEVIESDGAAGREVDHLGTESTDPSYDITELFNGLQPVLAMMRTDEINEFSQNALLLLEGDGRGLAPMLESTSRLASYASDRQAVISTLTANLASMSETLGGRSKYVMDFIRAVDVPISNALAVIDEFPRTASTGPMFLTPIERLLDALGLQEGNILDEGLKRGFDSAGEALASLRMMPAALAGLKVAQPHAFSPVCSQGTAHLPSDIRVLLSGSEVVLCNQ
ncbi:MlaD family protein [Rhodococcus qingshengii]|uniref:MlaD family protein n=1 Tax=Rhodococcus qingshengii TaxID=334542 RepID=UPI0036D9D6B0